MPSCAAMTSISALWPPACRYFYFFIFLFFCVCVHVCSLCTRAWKHIPALVMLHSKERPHCELSLQVRGPLWQVQMTAKPKIVFRLSARQVPYSTALSVLRTVGILPRNITFNPVSACFYMWERGTRGVRFGIFYLLEFIFYRWLRWPEVITLKAIPQNPSLFD